ncbi:MAG: general secretion pathway protein GspK [Nitrospirae bacterium]|nr:general secretion pathway protein GspK [Nitrospirota bacterium]
MTPVRRNSEGIALILVLWCMAILIGLSLTLSYMSRSESKASLNSKEYVRASFIAEGGINQAIVELLYRRKRPDDADKWKFDGVFRSVEIAGETCLIRLTPETAKVDLNAANEVILKGLVNALGIDADVQDIIVDSIQDWKDSDDLHRLHGAESDYYMSLKHPYKSKNAPFDAVDELLMVRGVTPDIFYGSEGKKGLRDLVTVYNKGGKININAAQKEVLMALPNVTEDVANMIIERRKSLEFKQPNELQDLLRDVFAAIQGYVDLSEPNVFTVDSIGKIQGYASQVGIRAIVELTATEASYLYYKAPEKFTLQDQEGESTDKPGSTASK